MPEHMKCSVPAAVITVGAGVRLNDASVFEPAARTYRSDDDRLERVF